MEKIHASKNFSARLVFVLHVKKERVLYYFTGKQITDIKIKSLNDYKDNVAHAVCKKTMINTAQVPMLT